MRDVVSFLSKDETENKKLYDMKPRDVILDMSPSSPDEDAQKCVVLGGTA
jgi:hypothetical protein